MALDEKAQVGESIATRLDALEARAEIHNLVSTYCHGCDKHDLEQFMSIWHEDAVWEIGAPYGDFHGAEQIRYALAELIWKALPETHHWTTNLVVDVDVERDRATGVCDVTCDAFDPDRQMILIAATYWDDFERRDGVWKIAKRKVDIFYFNPVTVADVDATPSVE